MNTNATALSHKNEEKDRKRGLLIAFFLHGGFLLLGLLPFLSQYQAPDPEPAQFAVIDFTDFKPASREGAKPAKARASTTKKSPKSAKKPTPTKAPAPAHKPVVTSPTPNPPLPTSPTKAEKPKPTKSTQPTKTTPTPAPTEEATKEDKSESTTSNESATSDNEENATEGGSGLGKQGDGKSETGDKFGTIPGDGIFNRKVIYRADVKKITELEGKIAVDLCINRRGLVTYAKPVKEETTIADFDVVRKAVQLTTRYRFERDETAPAKQCGRLTYIFEIEEE